MHRKLGGPQLQAVIMKEALQLFKINRQAAEARERLGGLLTSTTMLDIVGNMQHARGLRPIAGPLWNTRRPFSVLSHDLSWKFLRIKLVPLT